MISRKLTLALLASALLSAPAIAGEKAKDSQDDALKGKVCRRVTPTGSIMTKSVCASAKKWKEFDEQAAREKDQNSVLRRNETGIGGSLGAD